MSGPRPCAEPGRVGLVPHGQPGRGLLGAEGLQAQDDHAGGVSGAVGHGGPAGHQGQHGPPLIRLTPLELGHALQEVGLVDAGRLQQLVEAVQEQNRSTAACRAHQFRPADAFAGGSTDRLFDLVLQFVLHPDVPQRHPHGEITDGGEPCGEHPGQGGFAGAGLAQDQQGRLGELRRGERPGQVAGEVPAEGQSPPPLVVGRCGLRGDGTDAEVRVEVEVLKAGDPDAVRRRRGVQHRVGERRPVSARQRGGHVDRRAQRLGRAAEESLDSRQGTADVRVDRLLRHMRDPESEFGRLFG